MLEKACEAVEAAAQGEKLKRYWPFAKKKAISKYQKKAISKYKLPRNKYSSFAISLCNKNTFNLSNTGSFELTPTTVVP